MSKFKDANPIKIDRPPVVALANLFTDNDAIAKAFPELFTFGKGDPNKHLVRLGERPGKTRAIKLRKRFEYLLDRTDLNRETKPKSLEFRFSDDPYFPYFTHCLLRKDELIKNVCVYMDKENLENNQ